MAPEIVKGKHRTGTGSVIFGGEFGGEGVYIEEN